MPLFGRKFSRDKEKKEAYTGPEKAEVLPSDTQNSSASYGGEFTPHPAFLGFEGAAVTKEYCLVFDSIEPVHHDRSSRLSKDMLSILRDGDACQQFVKFMERCAAERYVQFWLDVQSFKASAVSRQGSQRLGHRKQASSGSCISQESTGKHSIPPSVAEEGKDELQAGISKQGAGKQAQVHDGSSVSKDVSLAEDADVKLETGTCKGNSAHGHVHKTPSTPSDSNGSFQSTMTAHGCDVSNSRQTSATVETHCAQNNDPGSEQVAEEIKGVPARRPNSLEVPYASQEGGGNCNNNFKHEQDLKSLSQSNDDKCGSTKTAIQTESCESCDTNSVNSKHCPNTGENCNSLKLQNSVLAEEGRVSANQDEDDASSVNHNTDSLSAANQNSFPADNRLLSSIAQDAVKLFSKYIAKEATHPIGVSEEIRASTISSICGEDGKVDPKCFDQSQQLAFNIMAKRYHGDFLLSDLHCTHQVNVLTGSKLSLQDVLYNDNALLYFTEFMDQEGVLPLLQCWTDMSNFEDVMTAASSHSPAELQEDAMVLYEKYFSLQANQPLGFPDDIRFEIESNICREEGPAEDCFYRPKSIVMATLRKVYLPQFLTSEIYYRFLSDLITTSAQEVPVAPHRTRRSSETGSEHSTHSNPSGSHGNSTRNTLLASETRLKKAIEDSAADMSMDETLFNPDSLWQRPQHSMTFGRVDELGRFVSEYDPDPEIGKKKKSGGLFFWRNSEKQQNQEDMAAQIANMIINDITYKTTTYTHDTTSQTNSNSESIPPPGVHVRTNSSSKENSAERDVVINKINQSK